MLLTWFESVNGSLARAFAWCGSTYAGPARALGLPAVSIMPGAATICGRWSTGSNERNPGSPIGLIGFSLGANLVLKLAAEASGVPVGGLDCVLAANPPIDLAACARLMLSRENRLYDWNFVRWLRVMVRRLHDRFPDLGPPTLDGVKTLYDFDDRYTAPRNGFGTADEYYRRCSLFTALARIQVPGLIVHAMDDPFVAFEPLIRAEKPDDLTVELVPHGGHLGYLSRRPWQGDRRWLDSRLAAWLKTHWAGNLAL